MARIFPWHCHKAVYLATKGNPILYLHWIAARCLYIPEIVGGWWSRVKDCGFTRIKVIPTENPKLNELNLFDCNEGDKRTPIFYCSRIPVNLRTPWTHSYWDLPGSWWGKFMGWLEGYYELSFPINELFAVEPFHTIYWKIDFDRKQSAERTT